MNNFLEYWIFNWIELHLYFVQFCWSNTFYTQNFVEFNLKKLYNLLMQLRISEHFVGN